MSSNVKVVGGEAAAAVEQVDSNDLTHTKFFKSISELDKSRDYTIIVSFFLSNTFFIIITFILYIPLYFYF